MYERFDISLSTCIMIRLLIVQEQSPCMYSFHRACFDSTSTCMVSVAILALPVRPSVNYECCQSPTLLSMDFSTVPARTSGN